MEKDPWDSDISIYDYSLIPDLRWCPCKLPGLVKLEEVVNPEDILVQCLAPIDPNGDHNW